LETNLAEWVMGPGLPLPVQAAFMNAFKNGVILIGEEGEADGTHLYQL
jgi:hypothetical protein